jgi:hypothetical protein
MPYLILLDRGVEEHLKSLHAQLRFRFDQITATLGEAPDNAQDPAIAPVTMYDTTFFTYLDESFPYVLMYRVARPVGSDRGVVVIFRLEGPTA